MSKLKELFLSKKELEKKKKDLMADAGGGGGAGGGGAGAGGGAGSGAGAGSGGGGGAGNSSGGGAHGNSSGMGGSAVSGDTGSADSTPSAPSGFHGIGTYMPGAKPKKKKKKKNFKFGDGIYEAILQERKLGDKHYDRNELPQLKQKHLIDSSFDYTFKEMNLSDIIPVQSQRVKGLVQSSEKQIINKTNKPLIIDNEGYLVNGHHRYDAANNLKMDKVDVIEVQAGIDELVSKFGDLVSNSKIEEGLPGSTLSSEDPRYKSPTEYSYRNESRRQLNHVDVVREFIDPMAQTFMLHGLRLDYSFNNTQEFKKYSPGYRTLKNLLKEYGVHKQVKITKNNPYSVNPGQTELKFGNDNDVDGKEDEQDRGMKIEERPQLTLNELRSGTEPGGSYFQYLDLIRGYLNRIEIINDERLINLDYIRGLVPGQPQAGMKMDTPQRDKYREITKKIILLEQVVESNIPKLMSVLYEIRNILVNRMKNGGVEEQSLDTLDVYLKDILDEKIQRNLKANKDK
jgi:hypothetical protein